MNNRCIRIISMLLILLPAALKADSDPQRISEIELKTPGEADRLLSLSYDGLGRLTLLEDRTSEPIYCRWMFSYAEDTEPSLVSIRQEGEWSYTEDIKLNYRNNQLTEAIMSNEDYPGKEIYSYNDQDRISGISWTYGDENTGKQSYVYDKGRLRKVIMKSYDYDFVLKNQWSFSYDKKGLISAISELSKEQDNSPEKSVYTVYRDKKGQIIEIRKGSSGEIKELIRFHYEEGLLSSISIQGRDESFAMSFRYEKGQPHVPFKEYILYLNPVLECLAENSRDGFTLLYMIQKF